MVPKTPLPALRPRFARENEPHDDVNCFDIESSGMDSFPRVGVVNDIGRNRILLEPAKSSLVFNVF
jgi:hypothetical protein